MAIGCCVKFAIHVLLTAEERFEPFEIPDPGGHVKASVDCKLWSVKANACILPSGLLYCFDAIHLI